MIWTAFAVAVGASLVLTPIAIVVLRRRGLLDVPNHRSSHDTPTPRGGGIAVGTASLIGLAASGIDLAGTPGVLAFGATAFGAIGLADDARNLSVATRLTAQVAVAGALTVLLLGDSDPTVLVIATGAVVTVWLTGFVNVFNFMDGINGLSVAQSAIAGAAWASLGLAADQPFLAVAGVVQVGAALGFAPFNVGRARVFLGDVGAYFIGGWMAALTVIGIQSGLAPEAALAPLAIYLLDTGTTLARRCRAGERWTEPHRQHVYQRLTDSGWTHTRTAAFAAAIIALCAFLGALTTGDSTAARVVADVGLVLAAVAYLDWPSRLPASETQR